MCVCTHSHIYTWVHTHTHTYVCTHLSSFSSQLSVSLFLVFSFSLVPTYQARTSIRALRTYTYNVHMLAGRYIQLAHASPSRENCAATYLSRPLCLRFYMQLMFCVKFPSVRLSIRYVRPCVRRAHDERFERNHERAICSLARSRSLRSLRISRVAQSCRHTGRLSCGRDSEESAVPDETDAPWQIIVTLNDTWTSLRAYVTYVRMYTYVRNAAAFSPFLSSSRGIIEYRSFLFFLFFLSFFSLRSRKR